MKTRRKGLKKQEWHSICSIHTEYNENCKMCNTGRWINVWKMKFNSLIYLISSRFLR
jgi:hypothetical protein